MTAAVARIGFPLTEWKIALGKRPPLGFSAVGPLMWLEDYAMPLGRFREDFKVDFAAEAFELGPDA
jgi:hypothetical protein